jgi:hypothetical protein
MMIWNQLKQNNIKAEVKTNELGLGFIKNEIVNLVLISNDMVAISSLDNSKYDELNLDTHADYDYFFKLIK